VVFSPGGDGGRKSPEHQAQGNPQIGDMLDQCGGPRAVLAAALAAIRRGK
jgi:hypothetical protein